MTASATPRAWQRLLLPAVALAVPLVLITLNVRLLASEAALRLEYGRPGFPAAPGFTDEERMALAGPSTLFLVRPITTAELAALEHEGAPLYTAEEIGHLVDVRRLVRRLSVLGALSMAVILIGAVAWRMGRLDGYGGAVERGGWWAVALVALVGLGFGVAWRAVFTGFHELFFPPGTWQFPADSGLIRLFPERFWFDTAAALAGLAAIEGVVVARIGRHLARARHPLREALEPRP